MRSTFDRNLRNICINTGIDVLNICQAKNKVKYHEISELNLWRVPVLKELLDSKNSNLSSFLNNFEVLEIMNYVACE